MKVFYVCSWGGCGSKLLCRYLNQFGKAIHIHDPNPPNILQYIGFKNGSFGWCPYSLPDYEEKHKHIANRGLEWFNGIPIDNKDTYHVIFLYRNPTYCIKSRFWSPKHLENIKSPICRNIQYICDSKKDLYNLKTFYNNYMYNLTKEYPIYAIKYEELFEKIHDIDKLFGINENRHHTLDEKVEKKQSNDLTGKKLDDIYKELIHDMNQHDFITIV